MSCCGSTRRPAAGMPAQRPSSPVPRPLAEPLSRQASVAFEYTGATRLAADGPVTRRRYRFEYPGDVVQVDPRDAASFAAIPNLRRAPAR